MRRLPLPEHASFCPYCAQSVRPRRSVKPPSHLWGKALRWGLGVCLALAAVAAGADGLIIEVHNDPTRALCDGAQSLRPEQFEDVVKAVYAIRAAAQEV